MLTFSLITVCYNAAVTIGRTLDSVKQQSWQQVEHIIIDGGSTDGTINIINDYQTAVIARQPTSDITPHSHTVNVISEPDKGIYDAMNKGVARAQGDYVCFLNAGDALYDADTLSTIASVITCSASDSRPAVIYGDTVIIDNEGNILGPRHLSAPEQLSSSAFRKGMLVCHQAFYARTDIAKATPYNLHYRYSADVDWCIRVMKEGERQHAPLVNAHTTVARYLQEGTTTRHHRASLKERFHVMSNHYGITSTLWNHILFLFRAVKRKAIHNTHHT